MLFCLRSQVVCEWQQFLSKGRLIDARQSLMFYTILGQSACCWLY